MTTFGLGSKKPLTSEEALLGLDQGRSSILLFTELEAGKLANIKQELFKVIV